MLSETRLGWEGFFYDDWFILLRTNKTLAMKKPGTNGKSVIKPILNAWVVYYGHSRLDFVVNKAI